MYALLALYARALNPREPVVCIDEKSLQLRSHSRAPLPMVAGAARKEDYECVRKGTSNLFVAVEPKAGRRTVTVTDRRCKVDLNMAEIEICILNRQCLDRRIADQPTLKREVEHWQRARMRPSKPSSGSSLDRMLIGNSVGIMFQKCCVDVLTYVLACATTFARCLSSCRPSVPGTDRCKFCSDWR